MKHARKIIALLLALCLALALCACGESKQEPQAKAEEPAKAELPAKTELPAKPDAPAATEAPAKTQAPAQTEKPAATEAPAPTKAPDKAAASLAGYYKMTESVSEGKPEDMAELESLGLTYYLVLEPDGTGYTDFMGEQDPLSWDDRYFSSSDSAPSAYSYADGAITIGDAQDHFVFTPLTDDELAYYLEHGSGFDFGFGGDGEYAEGEGVVDDYYIEFLGAEGVEDEDGAPALRVWYRFSNDSEEIISPLMAVSFEAYQDDEWMSGAFLFEDVPESENEVLGVAPGCDICCTRLYEYDPEGGPIEIKAYGWDGGVVCTLDPAALPGAPTVDLTPGYASDTSYLDAYDDADENVEILDAELVTNWDDEPCILIHCRFTNNSDEARSFFANYNDYALQDGIGLRQSYGADGFDEEIDNYSAEVAPGDSVEFAVVYLLRSDSSIAFAVKELFGGDSYIGCVYEFVD